MSIVEKMPSRPSAFAKYWELYGGFRSILQSGYSYTAALLVVVSAGLWTKSGWWDISIAVLPSMMGFSIAAFALIIAVGHERFLTVLATRPENWKSSALEGTAAAFFHFLFIQFLALVAGIIAKAVWPFAATAKDFAIDVGVSSIVSSEIQHGIEGCLGAIGFFLLMYAITCGLAASARIFSLAVRFGDLLQRDRTRAETQPQESTEHSQPVERVGSK